MREQSLGMILATAIAAPVVTVCRVGGLTLLASALVGLTGWLSGSILSVSILLAIAADGLVLSCRRRAGKRFVMSLQADEVAGGS